MKKNNNNKKATHKKTTSSHVKPKLLFTARSNSAIITKVNESYQLLINDIDHLCWFTDRPIRNAGKVSIDSFISYWSLGSDSFSKNPPNAAFIGEGFIAGKTEEMVVTLTQPTFNCSKKQMSFTVTPVTSSKIKQGLFH